MKKNKLKGKLIVLYGVNNLGKTTQAKMMVFLLRRFGKFIWSWQKNIIGKKLMLIRQSMKFIIVF